MWVWSPCPAQLGPPQPHPHFGTGSAHHPHLCFSVVFIPGLEVECGATPGLKTLGAWPPFIWAFVQGSFFFFLFRFDLLQHLQTWSWVDTTCPLMFCPNLSSRVLYPFASKVFASQSVLNSKPFPLSLSFCVFFFFFSPLRAAGGAVHLNHVRGHRSAALPRNPRLS